MGIMSQISSREDTIESVIEAMLGYDPFFLKLEECTEKLCGCLGLEELDSFFGVGVVVVVVVIVIG